MQRKKELTLERLKPAVSIFRRAAPVPRAQGASVPEALNARTLHVCVSVQDVSASSTAPVLAPQPFAFKMCTPSL